MKTRRAKGTGGGFDTDPTEIAGDVDQPVAQASSGTDSDEDPYIGRTISDRYRVLRKLGEGGMGVVYLAEHVLIEKKVALKILSQELGKKGDLVTRFMQEAKAASRIGHEHIVDITDFGRTETGAAFFAMEYLDGVDLDSLIEKEAPLPPARARSIMLQICRALEAAHQKGIVHRDMKPANIFLIARDGREDFVKILDFGIAKISSSEAPRERLTQTGMIFGTPEYMSPEQARGEQADQRADVYACGCILYEMLTGDVPFHAETFMGVLTKHMFEPPVPPSEKVPGIGAGDEAVVLRALAKSRDDRYGSMRELAQALTAAEGDTPTPVRADPSGEGRLVRDSRPPVEVEPAQRRRWVGILVGGVVSIAVALALWSSVKPEPTRPVALPATSAPATPQPAAPIAPVAPPAAVIPKAEPVEHAITIETTPPRAEIFLGAERLGFAPGPFKLEHSSEVVTLTIVKKGYQDTLLPVRPNQDRQYRTRLTTMPRSGTGKPKSQAPESHPVASPEAKPAPAAQKRDLMDPFATGGN